ncbi:MAG: universal stress protein [Nocardioidaceae bacterium]
MTPARKRILVVANETVAGRPLIDAVKRHADRGDVHVHVICPQNRPKHGYVIYDTHVRDAAENRLKMTLALLAESGIEASGEVMDPDPYAAVMDALGDQDYDEIIISTHPQTRSGWLRQGLVDRVERVTRRPVEHVVVDLDTERDETKRTLVVANQTVESHELLDALREMAQDEPHRFIVICPQSDSGDGGGGRGAGNGSAGEAGLGDARRRLAHTLQLLDDAGLEAVGQVVHPDPFTAIQNALQFYAPDEIVISTFPRSRSGWLRSDLVGRVRAATSRPVRHVVIEGGG